MITPLDIQNKVFKKNVVGYDSREVDEFLNAVIESYENLYKEHLNARDKIESLEGTIKNYKMMEETLQNTLVTAQNASDKLEQSARENSKAIIEEATIKAAQTLTEANAKAQEIIAEATEKAKQIVNDGHDEVNKLSYRYEELKREFDVYRSKMMTLIKSQTTLLECLDNETDVAVKPKQIENTKQESEI